MMHDWLSNNLSEIRRISRGSPQHFRQRWGPQSDWEASRIIVRHMNQLYRVGEDEFSFVLRLLTNLSSLIRSDDGNALMSCVPILQGISQTAATAWGCARLHVYTCIQLWSVNVCKTRKSQHLQECKKIHTGTVFCASWPWPLTLK